jgi:hypothetical protein
MKMKMKKVIYLLTFSVCLFFLGVVTSCRETVVTEAPIEYEVTYPSELGSDRFALGESPSNWVIKQSWVYDYVVPASFEARWDDVESVDTLKFYTEDGDVIADFKGEKYNITESSKDLSYNAFFVNNGISYYVYKHTEYEDGFILYGKKDTTDFQPTFDLYIKVIEDPKDEDPKDGNPKDGDPKDGDPKDEDPKDGDTGGTDKEGTLVIN